LNAMPRTMKEDVEQLTKLGDREVGSLGHETAREYLVQRMSELQLEPYSGGSFKLPYTGRHNLRKIEFCNLVGRIPGGDKPPILIGAHYDTCGP